MLTACCKRDPQRSNCCSQFGIRRWLTAKNLFYLTVLPARPQRGLNVTMCYIVLDFTVPLAQLNGEIVPRPHELQPKFFIMTYSYLAKISKHILYSILSSETVPHCRKMSAVIFI